MELDGAQQEQKTKAKSKANGKGKRGPTGGAITLALPDKYTEGAKAASASLGFLTETEARSILREAGEAHLGTLPDPETIIREAMTKRLDGLGK